MPEPDLATEFEAERSHLTGVAYRMLGSRAEAEDAVQETWLRYAKALGSPEARAEIRDLRGWLTRTIGRICLDVLRSARVRREAYPGQWLPEPVVDRLPGVPEPPAGGGFAPDPADRAVATDQLGIALLVLLDRLSPEQRVAFVLHDIFAVPFADVATTLGGTPEAARQLASRARRAVAGARPGPDVDLAEQRRVLTAFLAAAESGDLDRLLEVLAPDVVFIGDGGGHVPAARQPIHGAPKVAQFVLGLFRLADRQVKRLRTEPVLVNGALGVQFEGTFRDGRPWKSVLAFDIRDGRITAGFNQINPDKLTRVPPLGPDATDWTPRP
ncbi:RNA polymerase sigma factor SigJ [Plantactinospora siamensis]|uniref:RNA polymerase sigma factor SigJ n=1 Tax=Plantactinospora siamensis TaxID=555372 RepID=A0ABV6P5X8_9ACTN